MLEERHLSQAGSTDPEIPQKAGIVLVREVQGCQHCKETREVFGWSQNKTSKETEPGASKTPCRTNYHLQCLSKLSFNDGYFPNWVLTLTLKTPTALEG